MAKDIRDVWNAFMCSGAKFSDNDIPSCPTTATTLPKSIITWSEAKAIYHKNIKGGHFVFKHDAFVSFYENDYKFDGPRGIWHNYKFALKVLRHFAGAITPDFSTYQDFPDPLKRYNTYRMRMLGFWLGVNGVAVINNVRWGTEETWCYCYDGLPDNSMLCIGTVGGSPRRIADRARFEEGLYELVRRKRPHTIIVYGSANYPCFDKLCQMGISIIPYPSKTALAFERRRAV